MKRKKLTLRALRVNSGYTAKEAAKKLGIHHQTLLRYEHDNHKIPINLLNKLCILYKAEKEEIFLNKQYGLKRIN